MTWLIVGTVALIVFAAILWNAKKAGKDSVKAKAAKESLDEIRKANAPLHDADLERVRKRWRVD